MRRKRLAAALLAVCLVLMAVPVSAAGSAASLDEAMQAVNALGIVEKDGNLSAKVTRAEFAAMTVKAMPGGDGVGQAAASPYPDVPRSHWASGYVEAVVSRGLASAFSDGTFRPEQEIKLAEAVSMTLGLLGYGPEDFSGVFPTGQLAMYHSLKLSRGVSAVSAADSISRQDAVYLFYNLLSARTKDGVPYIQLLGHSLDASGKPDLISLINGEMEGPAVVQSGWTAELGFTPGRVYRNGSAAALSNIQDYDVVYWNASMGTVWAYAKKATGTIQAIEPSRAAPASVTVAGRSYAIESSAAAYALSDLGQYGLGDSVTLLLGRSGGVAAVADVSASAGERVGVVLESERASYPDGSGGTYVTHTVALLATDGQTYQYQTNSAYTVGSVVRATVASSGEVVVRGLSSAALSGTVSTDGTKLGKYTFAPQAEILDVGNKQGAVLSPSRLAGLTLDRKQVRYYSLNPQGEIDTLILSDVTGDVYQYGVLTRLEDMSGEGDSYFSYEYDIGGRSYALPGGSTRFPVKERGPIQVLGDPANPDRLYALTSAGKGQIVGEQFVAGSQKYTLSDRVLVYELRSGQYYLSSLARAQEEGRTLTAWYDKEPSKGGRIRVIVVQ